jgi:hypothetical protein
MTYQIAKTAKEVQESAHAKSVEVLKAVSGSEKGAFGMTPDHIKKTAEWKAAFSAERKAFADLCAINAYVSKNYKKEMRAERMARRLGGEQ